MAKKKAEVISQDKKIVTESFEEQMSKSYVDYAMSVIVERALPDVRDGLKPVQRRTLYDMQMLHVDYDKPYRKSARIVGDTMGKYHPHGDSSIYGALVHMSQDWVFSQPLVDKHGNMGSIEGDGAAAMRYCVTGDTLINTNRGLIRIDRIVPKTRKNSDNPINIRVKSVQGKINTSHMLFNSSFQNCIQIILKNGMSIKVSENHPLLVYAGDRKYKWMLAKDVTKDIEVIIDANPENAMFGNNNDITQAKKLAELFNRDDERCYVPFDVYRGSQMYLVTYVNTLFKDRQAFITKSEEFAKVLQIIMETQLGFNTVKSYNPKTKEYIVKKLSTHKKYERVKVKCAFKLRDKEIVYSIRVDSKCHSFTGNGFINHNTEARLSKLTQETMLDGLSKGMVDFVPNFDDTEKEPKLLPAKIPNLLISGSEGIAVGMACSIPSHNFGEVIEAAKMYLTKKKITLDDILTVIKGPDFATGGIIANASELKDMYRTGRGKLRVRGKAEIVDIDGKPNIIINEIPPTMIGRIDKFMQSIADLIRDKKAPDITNISNMSDKEGIKIIIELKKGSSAQKNLDLLYKKAKLEDTFSFNMLAVENNQPKTYSLLDYFESFTKFQIEINTRKYNNLLEKRLRDKEIAEGLIRAIDCIDTIIAILRGSKSQKDAMACLTKGDTSSITFKTKSIEKLASKLNFTEVQAEQILAMRLSRLIGLEIEALQKELDSCNKDISEYQGYLSSEQNMRNRIKKDLDDIKKKYDTPRRTSIVDEAEITIAKEEIVEQDYYLVIDKFRYAKLFDDATYQRNIEGIQKDYKYSLKISNTDKLLIFTDDGKMHSVKTMQIPLGKYKDKGIPLENLSNLTSSENIIFLGAHNDIVDKKLIFCTKTGMIKKVSGQEFSISTKSTNATKLADGDEVVSISIDNNEEVIIKTKNGMWIRFKSLEISEKKRNAVGLVGILIKDDDIVENVYYGNAKSSFLTDSTEYPFTRIKLTKRAGIGTKAKL